MKKTFGAFFGSSLVCLFVALLAAPTPGAPINYGDFEGTDVWYRDVTEDANSPGDEPPLFGEPTVSNNSIDFDPVGFAASATGAGGNDLTDGNLNFVIEAKDGKAINTLTLREAGDFTLSGFGDAMTFASITTEVFIDIFEVDGVAVNNVNVQGELAFTPSGAYDLSGGGPIENGDFSGELTVNINQALADAGVDSQFGATLVSVNLDNTLTALSQDGTTSLIAKKDADGVVIITNIPEPATVAMALTALAGLALVRRRS